jgi:hypothetical protein
LLLQGSNFTSCQTDDLSNTNPFPNSPFECDPQSKLAPPLEKDPKFTSSPPLEKGPEI